MPGQDGIWANDGREVGEDSAAEQLSFCSQPTALVIGQPEPFSAEMFSQNPVFLLQVTDDGLLVPVDPAGRGDDQQLSETNCAEHSAILSRMSFRTARATPRLFHAPCGEASRRP